MKIFLTGAAGHLGFASAQALAAAGHDVVGADRRYRAGFPGRLLLLDLREETAAYGPMEGCDALVHVGNIPNVGAAPTPQTVYRDNAAVNVNVLQAAENLGIPRIAFASSIQACAGDRAADAPSALPYLPLDGRLPPNPGNLYALGKVAAEDHLRFNAARRPSACIAAIRFPMLVGTAHIELLRAALLSGRVKPALDEGFSYLSLDDAAALLRAIVERPVPGFHLLLPAARGNSKGRPAADIVREFYPNVPVRAPGGALTELVDVSEIERVFGWTPKDNHLFDNRKA